MEATGSHGSVHRRPTHDEVLDVEHGDARLSSPRRTSWTATGTEPVSPASKSRGSAVVAMVSCPRDRWCPVRDVGRCCAARPGVQLRRWWLGRRPASGRSPRHTDRVHPGDRSALRKLAVLDLRGESDRRGHSRGRRRHRSRSLHGVDRLRGVSGSGAGLDLSHPIDSSQSAGRCRSAFSRMQRQRRARPSQRPDRTDRGKRRGRWTESHGESLRTRGTGDLCDRRSQRGPDGDAWGSEATSLSALRRRARSGKMHHDQPPCAACGSG